MRRVISLIVLLGLVAAACGDDAAESTDQAGGAFEASASGETYADELAAVLAELQRAAASAFEPVELALAVDDVEAAMVEAEPATATVTAAVDEARDAVDGLRPPDEYRTDQQTVQTILADLDQTLSDVADTAATGDGQAFPDRFAGLDRVVESGRVNLSPAVAGRVAVATTVLDEFPELDDDEVAYLGAVNGAFFEFAARNAQFAEVFNRAYADSTALLDALVDAGAGTAWAAVQAPVEELTPPATLRDDHERLVLYLDEAVAADEQVLTAAEENDTAGFLVANEDLAAAARSAQLDVSGPMRRAAFAGAPRPPEALTDEETGQGIWVQAAVLADTFLGDQFPGYRSFPGLSDEELVAATADIAPRRQVWLEQVDAELAALDGQATTPSALTDLIAYVDELQSLNDIMAERATDGDTTATLAALDELVAAWCEAGAKLNPELGAAVAVHLGPATADPRCAG